MNCSLLVALEGRPSILTVMLRFGALLAMRRIPTAITTHYYPNTASASPKTLGIALYTSP